MEKNAPFFSARHKCVMAALLIFQQFYAQTSVFSDDFDTSSGTAYTVTNGAVGSSSKWTMSSSGPDFGTRINGGNLTLTNDASGTANTSGWVMAAANVANFNAPYLTTLASNPGVITWTFNMRQSRSNPSGFGTVGAGNAFILAGSAGTTNVVGNGYAVVLGNSGTTDPIKLVRYTSGLRTATTLITSNTSGLTDFGTQYLSVKVTFTPSSNTWQLYLRNDGTAAFQDPASGNLVSQGSVVNNAGTGTAHQIMGAFWNVTFNSGANSNRTAFFDNVNVTVALPALTVLSPSSKVAGTGAFTLTVNGNNFVNGLSVVHWNGTPRPTTFVSATQVTAAIPASDLAAAGTGTVTVVHGAAISNALPFIVDPAGTPAIAVSSNAMPALSTVTGTPSAAQTYTVSGSSLTADVSVTAIPNFEISTNGTSYFSTLTLARSGNTLTGQPVTIYHRVKATAPPGLYSGNMDHSTAGAANKPVSVAATVLNTQPTANASAVGFSNVTSSAFTVNFTAGNGSRRVVLIRAAAAVNTAPTDGTIYIANPAFGAGSELGSGNYIVYAGSGSTVAVSGLSAATAYYVAVYEYNGSGGTENYTTSAATGNRTTLNAPVGWQIYTSNTLNSISFDNTVDGVNEDAYQSTGIAPIAEPGGLSSTAWAFTGFSDGNIAFGGSSDDDEDYDRGVSSGNETVGGVYAFETSADNFSLGFVPAAGDFTPGTATLRFQNQTGAAITSLSIGYKVYVLNNRPASTSFNFSHSPDNSTYTNVSGLNLTSVAAADSSPQWKAYYRVVTLTGLNVANNNYYYLRWSSAAVSGSLNFDEFALDDIVLVANPSTNFASFGGTAAQFIVQGNASLQADTTVAEDLTLNAGKLDLNGRTLTLGGNVINNIAGGIKGSNSSNLVINGAQNVTLSFDQTTPNVSNLLQHFTLNTTAGNTATFANAAVINGTLTTAAAQTLNLGSNVLSGNLTSIVNNGTISTQNTSISALPSGKTWGGNGTIQYNATAAQYIAVGTYQNLTVSTTAGATANGNLTVNGLLNLPSANPSSTVGSLSMANFTLTMGPNANHMGGGDVTGVVTRNIILPNTLYTFGNPHTSILFPPVGTLPTSMSLKIAIGAAPSWRTGAIRRTFDFIQTGGSGTKAVIKAHYLDSELNGNVETKLVDWARIVSTDTVLEQGRSNFNTTENWVELTNVNVGLYFSNAFNAVLLTLDESEANTLTWNGSVSNSWTTAANWTPNATPSDNTAVFIPNAATTPNDPSLNPAVLLGSLTIEQDGVLYAPDDAQLTINGGSGAWINNGSFFPGGATSRVIFTSPDATIAGITNFNNLTINSGAGLRPVTGNVMRIGGSLVCNGILLTGAIANTVEYSGVNQTVANPNGALAAYYNLIINGTGAVFPPTLNITGNLTLNQNVNFASTSLAMTGQTNQLIGGSAAANFNNLTIANLDEHVSLAMPVSVSGTLTLNSGSLRIDAYDLTLGNNAVAGTFSANRMIVADNSGVVRRAFNSAGSYTFPVGDETGVREYTPITVNLISGSFSNASVAVSVADMLHPSNASTDNNISRYWTVRQTGISGAVANISANYTAADLTGPEAAISAAQLNGIFNQANNPWIKFSSFNGNAFTATNASLIENQPAYFTGIKGAPFSTSVTGYGNFCLNEAVELIAETTEGNAPFTYSWSSGLGSQRTAVPNTAGVGTVSYTVIVKDSNGITASDTATVTTIAPTVGGSVSADQVVCAGSLSNGLQLSGHTGNVLHWEKANNIAFNNSSWIANASANLSAETIGNLSETTYFRAIVQNGSCMAVPSAPATISTPSTTFNSGNWSNGSPDSVTSAIFESDYTAAQDLAACTIVVNNGAVVHIPAGFNVTLNGALTVNSGSFILDNNANLLQQTNAANSGNITVRRNSAPIMRLDYTLWSSPVAGQLLQPFSPGTVSNRFYTYNAATDLYNAVADPSATAFQTGTGYLIRARNNHPTTPTIWSGSFEGVPHNGDYSIATLSEHYNAVGNPYPSTLDADAFISANAIGGALYFWRKTNNAATTSYATYTLAGGTGTAANADGDPLLMVPNGIIQVGQGFIVKAPADQILFTNAMRLGNTDDQFFRSNAPERHRIWLNLTNSDGIFSQTLVAYMEGATQGADAAIDGPYFNDSPIALTSLIGNGEYAVQGRPLPFDGTDIVPLGLKTTSAGTYSIALDHADGLFLGDNQAIWLQDHQTNLVQDLRAGSYTFGAEAGDDHTRFELMFQSPLSVAASATAANAVRVYQHGREITVYAANALLSKVELFDLRGRLLLTKDRLNGSEATFAVEAANQVLLLKITMADGNKAVRKIVH